MCHLTLHDQWHAEFPYFYMISQKVKECTQISLGPELPKLAVNQLTCYITFESIFRFLIRFRFKIIPKQVIHDGSILVLARDNHRIDSIILFIILL